MLMNGLRGLSVLAGWCLHVLERDLGPTGWVRTYVCIWAEA